MFHAAALRLCEQVVAASVAALSCMRALALVQVPMRIRRRGAWHQRRGSCEEAGPATVAPRYGHSSFTSVPRNGASASRVRHASGWLATTQADFSRQRHSRAVPLKARVHAERVPPIGPQDVGQQSRREAVDADAQGPRENVNRKML